MLEKIDIFVFPTVTEITIIYNDHSGQHRINTFLPLLKKDIENLILKYNVNMICICNTDNFSKKVYENLITDEQITCLVKWMGE